jgi:hypothetical protein
MKTQTEKNKGENTMVRTTLALLLGAALALPAGAQEVLPKPEQPFKGKIGRTAKDSTPDFPKPLTAPKGAPNCRALGGFWPNRGTVPV